MRVLPAVQSRVVLVGVLGLLALEARPASAQQGAIRGVVVDTAGSPVPEADVGILALRRLVRTDQNGRFSFDKLPVGEIEFSVRRLAYEPTKVRKTISGTTVDSIRVVLKSNAALLAAIDVSTSEIRLRRNIEDFHRRRIQGTGQYITREQVEGRWGGNPSDLLRSTSGIRLIRSANGGYAARFPNTSLSRNDCAPLIWIDGQKAPGLEIDDIPLRDIEGIEMYSGPATTPMQFSTGQSLSACGTIVIWSRPPQYQRYPKRP